jgi:hypothetical protein
MPEFYDEAHAFAQSLRAGTQQSLIEDGQGLGDRDRSHFLLGPSAQ